MECTACCINDILPPEILLAVFKFLDLLTLVRASFVCDLWRVISRDASLWKTLSFHKWLRNKAALKIRDSDISRISKWCSPVVCDLSFCTRLTDRSFFRLASCCSNLTTLLLVNVNVSDRGMEVLLPRCTALEKIHLQQCPRLGNSVPLLLAFGPQFLAKKKELSRRWSCLSSQGISNLMLESLFKLRASPFSVRLCSVTIWRCLGITNIAPLFSVASLVEVHVHPYYSLHPRGLILLWRDITSSRAFPAAPALRRYVGELSLLPMLDDVLGRGVRQAGAHARAASTEGDLLPEAPDASDSTGSGSEEAEEGDDDDDDDDDDDNTDNDDDNTDNHVNHKVTDNNNNDDRNFAHGDLVESDSEERHQGTTTSSSSLPDSVSLNLARDTEHASNSATQASTNTTDTTTTSKSTSASASTSSSESSTSSGSWWTFSLGWRSSSGESNNDGHTDASAAKKNSDTNKADDGEHRWSSIRYSFCHPGSFETLAVQPADQTLHLIEAPKVWRGTMSSTLRLRGRLQQLDELDQALIYIYVRNGDEPWRLLHEWVPSLIRHKTEPVPWPMCSYVSEAWGLKCPLRGSEISTIDIPLPTGTISSWLAPDDIAFHAITVHNSPPLENRDWYEWKDHLIDLSEKETRPLFGLVLTRFMSTLCNEEEPTHPDSPPHSDAGDLSPDAFESEDDAKSKIAAYCDHIDIDQPDAASETDSTT